MRTCVRRRTPLVFFEGTYDDAHETTNEAWEFNGIKFQLVPLL